MQRYINAPNSAGKAKQKISQSQNPIPTLHDGLKKARYECAYWLEHKKEDAEIQLATLGHQRGKVLASESIKFGYQCSFTTTIINEMRQLHSSYTTNIVMWLYLEGVPCRGPNFWSQREASMPSFFNWAKRWANHKITLGVPFFHLILKFGRVISG